MDVNKLYPKFFIKLGTSGDSTFYVKDGNGDWQKFNNYSKFKIVKRQNQISEFHHGCKTFFRC